MRRNRVSSGAGVRLRVFLVLTLLLSSAVVLELPSTPPAGACPFQVESSLGGNGTYRVANCNGYNNDDRSQRDGQNYGSGGPVCWRVLGHDGEGEEAPYSANMRLFSPVSVPPPPEVVTWWWDTCKKNEGCEVVDGEMVGCDAQAYYFPFPFFYTEPVDLAPGEPIEALLLPEVWAIIEGQLEPPEVELEPPEGDPVIVQLPTFVSVTDPPATVEEEVCADSLGAPQAAPCVAIEAVPTLHFDPGDGSDTLECEPEGTAYDRERDATPQAEAPGACAHVYEQHTSGGGSYPVRVYTTWDMTWQSTDLDGSVIVSGTFDPLDLDADIAPRAVDEVQTTVDDVELGENAE